MNYSTFEISALWHWIERLFVYQADSPLMMGSIPFALLFIFFLAIYTLLKSYSRTAMMMYVICFSLFFAYKVNGMVMWMLPLTACINYAVTQEMRLHEGKARKALLTFVVLVDLALLCYFKYTNFIIGDVVNEMFSTNFSLQSIALPVGISFYTFQAISYAVDTYKRKFDMEVTLLEYCFYLTFFPLLMAGPIHPCRQPDTQTETKRTGFQQNVVDGTLPHHVGTGQEEYAERLYRTVQQLGV